MCVWLSDCQEGKRTPYREKEPGRYELTERKKDRDSGNQGKTKRRKYL